jgi:hypothetical protein
MLLDRRTRLLLSAYSELNERTVERAADRGISSLRSECDRQRIRRACRKLPVELPEAVGDVQPRVDDE